MAIIGLPFLAAMALVVAGAAATTVPSSRIDHDSRTVSSNALKPDACNAQSIENLITGTGAISGTSENDLILGGSGNDIISGEGGDDCIVGGGGDDTLIGNGGNDTCIGGSGSDTFDDTCERID
jgi:Ca2+-binding RTX toxin-like protein